MPEQTIDVVSGSGNVVNPNIGVPDGVPAAETMGVNLGGTRITWVKVKGVTIRKTLTQRFNEAYDEEAKREDEEFFRNTKAYYSRRFSAEN